MRKKVGIIKRMSCLLLMFLLSINSFAAIVSDNDGSAFITKAEFDALKSSFQGQIDTYNQSIDSKIDGAIASYLAGIKLQTNVDVPLCGGSPKRLAFFTPSVQTTNWKRGQMGIDVTESRNGEGARNGSYDYHGMYHISRDASVQPFEAIIKKDGGLFYTNDYQLNYFSTVFGWYFNTGKSANYAGFGNKYFAWHCYDGGTLTSISKTTSGSDGGGLGKYSHYPLRSDWWLTYVQYSFGQAVAGSTTKNYGTSGSAGSYPSVAWTVTNEFTDNVEVLNKMFFCTQGSTASQPLKVWDYSLTNITSVGDLQSGWTTSDGRSAELPSDNNVVIDYGFAGSSLAQSIGWSSKMNYEAGTWRKKIGVTASTDVNAGTWYEPELQMVDQDQEISWIDQNTYVNDLKINASTWTAKPYNGFPIVKWENNWKSLSFNVDNTNGSDLRLAFSDTQFAKDSWIQNYNNPNIKIELDGVAVSGSNFKLTTGSHEIKIMPTTTIGQLFVTVGWDSTTKTERGYLDIPNLGLVISE